MKLPHFSTLTFEKYLNIKKRFLEISVRKLQSKTSKELIDEGYRDIYEIKDMLKHHKLRLQEVKTMIRYNNIMNRITLKEIQDAILQKEVKKDD